MALLSPTSMPSLSIESCNRNPCCHLTSNCLFGNFLRFWSSILQDTSFSLSVRKKQESVFRFLKLSGHGGVNTKSILQIEVYIIRFKAAAITQIEVSIHRSWHTGKGVQLLHIPPWLLKAPPTVSNPESYTTSCKAGILSISISKEL
jgi:hypothetical protein